MICEHDLSGLEMRILIRLSNCYGRDGLICPSNAKLAIWLGKITQEEYEKSDKTKVEQKKLESAKRVIKNAMKKLSDKKFIETERIGNSRKIFLLKPQHDKESELIKYKGASNGHPLNKRGHQMVTPGDQIITPRASNDHPPIINNKNNNKINSALPKKNKYQASQIFWFFPQNIKSDRNKAILAKNIVRTGIDLIGYDATKDLVQKISAESHPDYVAALENRINEVV